jgi:hypothetical protein
MKTTHHPLSLALGLILPFIAPKAHAETHPDLGKGILRYDAEAGLKDLCIQAPVGQATVTPVGRTEYTVHLVQSKEELHDKISTSASASGSFGSFSAGAKAKFVKEIHWNYNSTYLLIKASRISKRISLPAGNTLLNRAALNLLLDSQFRFSESCGSGFIRDIDLGAEVYGVMEIMSSNHEEKQRIETSIRAGGGFFGGSASGKAGYQRMIEKLSSEFRLSLKLEKTAQAENLPDTIEGLLNLSQRIESIGDADPKPVAYSTRDYTTLSNYETDPTSPTYQVRQIQIDEAGRILKQARQLQSKILYILENPRDFKRFDEASLQNKLGYLDDKILDLKIAIEKARSFQYEMDTDLLSIDLSVELPTMKRRAQGLDLTVSCEVKPDASCGVESYKLKQSSACGALAPKEGTGPVCGITYKLAAHPSCGAKQFNFGTGAACGVKSWNSCHACGKQKYPGGPRTKEACSKCGVKEYNSCRNENFGPEEFNVCRTPENGVESYGTCRDKSFGYDFASCRHFTHGPETHQSCEVSRIGERETACPKF